MTAPARKSAPQTPPPRTPTKATKTTKSTARTAKPTKTTRSAKDSKVTAHGLDSGLVNPKGRSAAAERAYARRAQRTERAMVGPRPDRRSDRRPGSAGRVTFVVLVIVLLIGGVIATLWFSTQAAADAYALGQAKAQTAAMAQQVQRLRQDVAKADSAPSLAARARALGMVPAGDPAHLVVGPDGKVTLIGRPSAVTTTPPPPSTTTPPPSTSTATSAPNPAGR